MKIERVAVAGTGVMGWGLARLSAQGGYPTLLWGRRQASLDRALENIRRSLDRDREKGRLEEARAKDAWARLRGTLHLEDLRDCDLIMESIVEDMEEKQNLFARLDAMCPPQAILSTNTSSLSVAELAAATKRPERMVGLHFSNPPHIMKMMELVTTPATDPQVVETARDFGRSLGKEVYLVQDTPGFILNRLLIPYLLDGVRALEAGLASAQDIDSIMVVGGGFPMGPLAMADHIGLDVVLWASENLHRRTGDPRFQPPPLLRRLVEEGRLGRKARQGFFPYP